MQGGWHRLADDETAFEDGTLDFLSIPDVTSGLAWISDIGIDLIHRRVGCLTGWLLDRLAALKHANGAPMVRLYGPRDTRARGGTVAFNFLNARGGPTATGSPTGTGLRRGCAAYPAGPASRGAIAAQAAGTHAGHCCESSSARGRDGLVTRQNAATGTIRASLRYPAFRWLVAGLAVSQVGGWLYNLTTWP